MKKILVLAAIFIFAITACSDPGDDKVIPETAALLKISNNSRYALYNVRYSSSEFEDIGVGGNKTMNVSPDSLNPIYFALSINNRKIQCYTMDEIICEKGSTREFNIINDRVVTAIESQKTDTIKGIYEALSKPIFQLSQDETVIANNEPLPFDFGQVEIDTNKSFVFTIKNLGNLPLELTGDPVILSSNAVFTVPSQPANKSINPGSSIAFILQYSPIEEREDTATINIFNNSDDLVFTLNVSGNGYKKKPVAVILHNSTVIPQNGTIQAEEALLTLSKTFAVTIKNSGDAPLIINIAEISITGDDCEAFKKITNPNLSIQAGNETSFYIEFKPVKEGENNAILTIPTNDSTFNPGTIFLRAQAGPAPKPVVAIYYSNNEILQNNEINAGSIMLTQSKEIEVTIKNTGTAVLTIDTGNISITNAAFALLTSPVNTIAAGSESIFRIECLPAALGDHNASLIIPTNDSSREQVIVFLRMSGIPLVTHTVTFDSNGGSNTTAQTIVSGKTAIRPENPAKDDFDFVDWYSNSGLTNLYNFSLPVIGDLTLYAKWDAINNVPGANLAAKLLWLQNNAISGITYTVEVNNDESINPTTLSYGSRYDIGIALKGIGAIRTVSLSANGSLFTISSGVTLILHSNLKLQGRRNPNNNAPLVRVNSGGTLIINEGTKITDNYNSITGTLNSTGGGVYLNGGNVLMKGGEISNNTSYVTYSSTSSSTNIKSCGGGVYINTGTFTMDGGVISSNEVRSANNGVPGIVSGSGPIMTMKSFYQTAEVYGGGVYVDSGLFTLNDGKIINNKAIVDKSTEYNNNSYNEGGGIYINGNSGFIAINGGEISQNEASGAGLAYGGGIIVKGGGTTHTMKGSVIISGNVANGKDNNGKGGGICVGYNSGFIMEGGEIFGNTASGYGGGVYLATNGIRFLKTGGTIFGHLNALPGETPNVVKYGSTIRSNRGHAVYAYSTGRRKEKTAGPLVILDTTKSASAGGGWDN